MTPILSRIGASGNPEVVHPLDVALVIQIALSLYRTVAPMLGMQGLAGR